MQCALDWLGTAKPVVIAVVAYNERAIAFYKTHGFQECEESLDSQIKLDSGVSIPLTHLVKE